MSIIDDILYRLTKLENDFDKIEVEERLHSLEQILTDACEQIENLQDIGIEDRFHALQSLISSSLARNLEIALLHTKVANLEEAINRITEDDMKAGRKPHKCPKCYGCGIRIYENQVSPCSSCEGKGIVWG